MPRNRNEHSVEIESPAAMVFTYLVEEEKLMQWLGGLVESEPLTTGEVGVGSRSREVIEVGRARMEVESEITGYRLNELLEARIFSKDFETTSIYRLRETEGRTLLRSVVESEYKALLARLLSPLITRQAQKKLEADLARLKQIVEAREDTMV